MEHMHCKQKYPRCYKRQREANDMSCDMYCTCSVLLFDLNANIIEPIFQNPACFGNDASEQCFYQ